MTRDPLRPWPRSPARMTWFVTCAAGRDGAAFAITAVPAPPPATMTPATATISLAFIIPPRARETEYGRYGVAGPIAAIAHIQDASPARPCHGVTGPASVAGPG